MAARKKIAGHVKGWFQKCVKRVQASGTADDARAVCGAALRGKVKKRRTCGCKH